MTTYLQQAKEAHESLGVFAGQVEDQQRTGDLGQLLGAGAVALGLLAIAEALHDLGEAYGVRNP